MKIKSDNWQKQHNKNLFVGITRRVIRKSPFLAIGLIAAITGAVIFALIPPLVLERLVNLLAEHKGFSFSLVISYVLLLILSGLFDTLKEVLITIFGQRITKELRHRLCLKLSGLPASYFSVHEPGETTSLFVNDVSTVEALFTSGIISMFVDGCKVISIVIIIFRKSPGLGMLLIIVTPLLFLFTLFIQRRMLKAQIMNRVAVGKASNHIPETLRNIRMIHSFKKERYMEKKYGKYIKDGYKSMEKSNLYDAIYSPVIVTSSAVVIAVMMVMTASNSRMQIFFGMSVGTAVAIINYVGKVFDPLESIGMEIQNVQSAFAGMKRIGEFVHEQDRKPQDLSITAEQLIRTDVSVPYLDIKDLIFGYDKENPVLQNVSFTVQKGERVTLTGRTGAGKSTIFKLILGFYAPDGGQILVCGKRADQIPDLQKRRLFGYVEQNFQMVPGSVLDQITLFDESISQREVEEVAKLVGLHDRICEMPLGYDTYCDQTIFSQGQWQLLSIARAIAASPSVLLLDEITANLDSETEHMVVDALGRASEDRTVLSISHRLYEKTGGRIITI